MSEIPVTGVGVKRKNNTILSFFKKKKNDDPGGSSSTASTSGNSEDMEEENKQENSNKEDIPTPFSPSNDIGVIVKSQIGDKERKIIMDNPWYPDPSFNFPASGKRNLKFKYQWMARWKWLLYSKTEDGAYCRYCALFSSDGAGRGSQPLGVLVKKPFNRWKDSVEQFNGHEKTSYHKSNVLKAEAWKSVQKGIQPSVELQQNSALQKQILENRKSVLPIIETVIFCGRQGIALRAHRDHGPLDLNEEQTKNEGNFRALLRFRACSGDVHLKNHLESGPKNALYLGPNTQNEIISACNQIMLNKLVIMVNSAQCFTVLADETTDISTKEQLSIGVRYVYNSNIREDFLQFVPVYDLTGEGLATVILRSLDKFGVNTRYLRGQGYDGASAMSGKFNGVQACVRKEHKAALYVHCASHSLNLAISSSCSVPEIRNFCGTATKVCAFLYTPKRSEMLKKSIEEKCPEAKATKLKKMCPTRWVERHDAILLLEEMLPAVHNALEEIKHWEDTETASSALHLQCAIENSSFLISLQVLVKIFSLSLPLCRSLQLDDVDLLAAINMVNQLKDKIKEIRSKVDSEFSSIYEQAQTLAELFGTNLVTPRLAGRQTQRCNVKVDSPETYYKIAIFLPFLDHFLSELQTRFLNHQDVLSSFMCLMPTKDKIVTAVEEEQMRKLVEFYSQDLQSCDKAAVGELHLWYERKRSKT